MRVPVSPLLALLALTGCQRQAAAPPPNNTSTMADPTIAFAGPGRDRLCEAGARIGLISYAPTGDRNCSVRGTLRGAELIPDGDIRCRIAVSRAGDSLRLGPVTADCAYYCAAPASFAGKTFVRMAKPERVADSADDPLC